MVSLRDFVTVPPAFEAFIVTVETAAFVGVPVMYLVEELKLKPDGSPVTVIVIVSVPVTLIACE